MSWILCLETATEYCSVALSKDGNPIYVKEERVPQSHSKLLSSYVDELLKEANMELTDLDAIAVGAGPGSYTGLRICTSFAQGIAFSLNKKLIAVNTLLGLAYAASKHVDKETIIAPMIDARRMEVFSGVYTQSLELLRPLAPLIIDKNSFSEFLCDKNVAFIGSGTSKLKNIIKNENALFIDHIYCSSLNITYLADSYLKEGKFADLAYYQPSYLKPYYSASKATHSNN